MTTQNPTGELTKYSHPNPDTPGIDVYISKPPDYPTTPARLLLLLTGGTGVHSTNNQLQADVFASHGYVVVMPDMFSGDPAPNSKPHSQGTEDSRSSFIEAVKLRAAETAKSFMIDMWLARQTREKVMPIITHVLRQARDEFADAVSRAGGVYAVGYCFGARYVLLLAGEEVEEGQAVADGGDEEARDVAVEEGPFIKAGAIAHASMVERSDLKAVKVPITMACVENDPLFPAEILDEGREYLSENHVEHQIEIYKEVPHGFAVVGEYESSTVKQAQTKAFDQMLQWLNSH